MLSVTLLFFCVVACHANAVLPIVVPAGYHAPLAVPAVHGAPFAVPAVHGAPLAVPAVHGAPPAVPYGVHRYAGHALLNQGWGHKPVHHLLKRSPHLVPLEHDAHLGDHLGAVAPVAHIAPVAVSHQSRVDVHTSPAVVAAPVLPVVKAVAVPILHKSFLAAPYHFGVGHYGHSASAHHDFGHY